MDDLQLGVNNPGAEEDAGVKRMNYFQKLAGVIFSPGTTMKSIIAKPGVLLPIITIAVAPVLIYLARLSVYLDEAKVVADKTMQRMSEFYLENGIKISQEQLSATSGTTNPVISLVSLAFSTLLAWFVGTVILFAFIKIFKGKGRFSQVISISGYAYVILLLQMLLIVGASFATGSLKLDLSLGVFSDRLLYGTEGTFYFGFMHNVLAGFNIFTIWNLIVVGIGVASLTKLSKTKLGIILGIIFVVPIVFSGVSGGISEAAMGLISAIM